MEGSDGAARLCKVCGATAAGIYFGALVCLPCKSFYIRCTKDDHELRCQQDASSCTVNKGRFKCQACRFKACLQAGMQRKEEKPEIVNAPAGRSLCQVCGDLANGVHFGVVSCEGCKKFFRRGLNEYQNYTCQQNGNCPINPRTRNACRYCRYQACLKSGMSREAIKVGRPPNSKKENTRHHPYQHNVISESNQKLHTGNNYMKPEVPWKQGNNSDTLLSLPALIHTNGTNNHQMNRQNVYDRQHSSELNASCTSTDMHNLLMSYLGPDGQMAPLPSHIDFDDTFALISDTEEPTVARKPGKLDKLENPPHKTNAPRLPTNDLILGKNNGLLSMKSEPGEYREVRTHPSPPYAPEPNYSSAQLYKDNSYRNGNQFTNLAHQNAQYSQTRNNASPNNSYTSQDSPYSVMSNQSSPQTKQSTYSIQNSPYNAMSNQNSPQTTSSNHGSPYNHYQMSQSQQRVDQYSSNQQKGVTAAVFHSDSTTNGFVQRQQQQQRPSCEQEVNSSSTASYLSQPQLSPFNSSCSGSPHSSSQTTSGYATDSQDFLDEFSIYDPVDIRQVNHKYMPSCSFEPLVFNEEAITVDDFWSKNEKHAEADKVEKADTSNEGTDSNSQRFKHMNSIDDKIDQEYWFKHEIPDQVDEYNTDMTSKMKYLMTGWLKSKAYYLADQGDTSKSDKEAKTSHWPNVKENAPLQLKMWEFIKTRLLRGTTAQVMFFQHLSGSGKVEETDQKLMVSTASFSNCLLMNIFYWWDEEKEQCKYFWSWKIPASDPFHVFRLSLLKFSCAIRDLNFDEKEIMLACALILFSSDIINVKGKEVIEKERKSLLRLASAYMKDKYKSRWQERLKVMLSMVPALRYLSIWHHDMMAFAKTFGPSSNGTINVSNSANGLSLEKMRISES